MLQRQIGFMSKNVEGRRTKVATQGVVAGKW
jgi:hypothetical protein